MSGCEPSFYYIYEPENISRLNELLEKCSKYTNDKSYVYKLCCDVSDKENRTKWLVIMQKLNISKTNEDRTGVVNKDHVKFRANKLEVVEIIDINDPSINKDIIVSEYYMNGSTILKSIYRVGNIIEPHSYNENINSICAEGIHYFKTPLTAYYYRTTPKNYTGIWIKL